ncbi:MAG: hypothetical protein Q7S96_02980 [bacterium]|nr:hypothetical protein [bacterium]
MATREFPLDIGSVKAFGVDRWRETCSWPVPDHEFIALADAVEGSVRSAIAATPGDVGAALLIARELPVTLVHMLHARAVVVRVRAAGHEPVCQPAAAWFAEALGHAASFTASVGAARAVWMVPAVRLVRWGRGIAANATAVKMAARVRSERRIWVAGAPHALLAEYLAHTPEWVRTLYNDALPPMPDCPVGVRAALRIAAASLVDACTGIAQQYAIPTDDAFRDVLRTRTDAMLVDAVRMLLQMRAFVAAHAVAHVALGSATQHRQRALALAVRERGGRVMTAAHGGFVGLFNTAMPTWSEFALSDTYVTYTDGSADLCRRIHRARLPIVPNPLTIVSGVSGIYRAIRQRMRPVPAAARIRRVMVIGFPQNAQRKYTAAASLGLQQLDLELRIIEALRDAGYGVVYKAHPDRLAEVRGMFDGRAEVLAEDFHTAHTHADAFVFGSMRTTAFPIALCTTKPIVALLVDGDPAPPFPDALALLARRVRIVRAACDDRARVVFDARALCDAVAQPADPTDTAFLDRYLLPSSD